MDQTNNNQQPDRPGEAEGAHDTITPIPPTEERPGARTSRRGGRRPGAGAPKGNLNGLKHGRRSKQVAALGMYIAADPRMRAMILRHSAREGDLRRRADRAARRVFANILERGIKVGKKEEQELNDIIADMLE